MISRESVGWVAATYATIAEVGNPTRGAQTLMTQSERDNMTDYGNTPPPPPPGEGNYGGSTPPPPPPPGGGNYGGATPPPPPGGGNYGGATPPPPPGGGGYDGGAYGAPPPPAGGYGGPPAGPPPSNNLILAIVSLLCCWPIGIPAVVFAAQVNGKWNAGDQAGAVSAADKAKKFALAALVLGVIAIIIGFAAGAFSGGTSSTGM